MPQLPFDIESLLRNAQQPQVPPAPIDPRMAQLQGQMDAMDAPKKPGLADILSTIGRGVSTMNPAQFQQIELQRQQQEQQASQQKRQMLAQQIQQIQTQQRQTAQDVEDRRRYDQEVATGNDRYKQQMDIKGAEVAGRQMGSLADINQQGVVNDRAERGLRLQEQAATAPPKEDSSLTPFELWAKQNPDGKVSDWFKLSEKPTGAGSQDQDWVYRNGEVTPIPKGTARPGDKPYDAKSAPAPVPSSYANERTTRTLQSVDELMNKVSGWTTGFGSLADSVPTSSARNFKAELDTLKANIAFNELTAMREASKTGGALGQVSNRELGLLESALGALDTRQTADQFKAQLLKIRTSIERWQKEKEKLGGAQPAAPPQGQRGQPSPNIIRYDEKGNRIR